MKNSKLKKYEEQKGNAAKRGLPFSFSFEEWVSWWETQLGPNWEKKRGCFSGKFVMARKDDKGGYSVDNVECILHSKNVSEMSKNNTIAFGINQGRAKLNEEAVRDIFQTTDSYRNLCHKYQIKVGTILDIRRRVTWKRITDKLTRKSLRGRKGLRQIA